MTLNDLEQSKRICNHLYHKINLLRAQRSAHVSSTYIYVLVSFGMEVAADSHEIQH